MSTRGVSGKKWRAGIFLYEFKPLFLTVLVLAKYYNYVEASQGFWGNNGT